MRPTSGYRDPELALDARRAEHEGRLRALDGDAQIAGRRALSTRQQTRFQELRRQAQPEDDSARALAQAEEAVQACERLLDEELGLSAELHKSLEPWLPPAKVAARWAGFAALSLGLLVVGVRELRLDGFMLAAVGMKTYRPAIELGPSAVVDTHALRRAAAMRRCAPLPLDELLGCRAPEQPAPDDLHYSMGAASKLGHDSGPSQAASDTP